MHRGGRVARPQITPSTLWVFVVVSILSFAGTRLAAIAVPWYVLTTTGSPTLTGVVAFAELAPYIVVKALAGPFIDRAGPVRVALVGDAASACAIAGVPLLHAAGLLSYPALVALVAIVGILRAPGDGAKTTLVPLVARASGSSLEKVSGAYGAVDRLAATLGAAFGGIVVAAVGGASALWLTVATLALDLVVLALVLGPRLAGHDLAASPGAPAPDTVPPARASYLDDLREGWRFLRGDAVLVAVVVMLAFTNMLEQAFGVAFVPMWALLGGGGPRAIGSLFAVSALLSVVGAVVAAVVGARLPRRPVYAVAYLLVGLPRFAILAVDVPLPVTIAVLAVGGFAAGFINPILGAVVVERIPGPLMGRVNTLAMACAWALLPFGGIVGGLLVTEIGLPRALWVAGLAYVVVTMAPTLLPAWRQIERPAASSDAADTNGATESDDPGNDGLESAGVTDDGAPVDGTSPTAAQVTPPRAGSVPATAGDRPGSSPARAARRGRRAPSRHR
ncbi:MFS transporter [Mobilicoccus pelagius]|uniref:Putative major facilitator superfamily transporter n=1 Tax=Mobilicoccus pelagius NBRC 104925 TaxID=1089455 RepID=H5UT52_9MICO|nr:MFS transporter [Mobilicoccus pelagius]GAB48910.1 putative major facilitator superfamily transporter [Mobilicoccus pelagius NBRC 104925]